MVSRDNPGDSAERDIFLREICESPDTLLHSAEALAAQAGALAGIRSTLEGRRVTLTGMGSSADAVTGLASILGRRGMDCPNIHTAELLHYRMDALGPGAAVVAVIRVKRAFEILGEDVPENLREAGEFRIKYPEDSLNLLGERLSPPATKDAVAGRLRRLNTMADKRAAELGVPSTLEAARNAGHSA